MTPVLIESPLGTRPDGTRASPEEVERNQRYLDACMRHSFARGEAPWASHKAYPGVLNDDDPEQRRQGMVAGWEWGRLATLVAVYVDHGITDGMRRGIERAKQNGQRIEYRTLPARKCATSGCWAVDPCPYHGTAAGRGA